MKTKVMIALLGFLLTGVMPAVTEQALAEQAWVEGKVTDRSNSGEIHFIQLDGKKTYMLMKGCRIKMRFEERPGAFNEEPVDFGYVRKGQKVTLKAEDNRAFQVLILE